METPVFDVPLLSKSEKTKVEKFVVSVKHDNGKQDVNDDE